MAILIATSILRGGDGGESHGGVYLINLETGQVLKPVDSSAVDVDREGRGRERGLRGIACHRDRIYIATGEELLDFDQAFNAVASFRNAYLQNCPEICVFERHLFLASAGFDAILGFNLETESFDWAFRIVTDGRVFGARRFDPNGDEGPLLIDKLQLNNVHCEKGGMYVSGKRTGALLRFGGDRVGVKTTLPEGIHNAPLPGRRAVQRHRSRRVAVRKPHLPQSLPGASLPSGKGDARHSGQPGRRAGGIRARTVRNLRPRSGGGFGPGDGFDLRS
ncbi:MAG: hypothetical protein OXE40_14515 [Gammaproteobacteria bacterium]|nr:hypothetical protein [Gammaproteobacteria bacterium]